MDFVLLKCNKNDYMIVSEVNWKEFNVRKNSIPKKDQKDRTYKLKNRVFSLKETKKLKNMFLGSYVDMYKLMPELVVPNCDYKELTDDILLYLEKTPGRKWEFVVYFASEFTFNNFKTEDYDFYYESQKKYEFIKLFKDDDIKKIPFVDYMYLVEIALKARYDENNLAIDNILNDQRFELPKDFDIQYSDEMEFDEKLKFIKDKEIIRDFFLNNRRGLHRFLVRPNVYTPELITVLADINPMIYSVDDKIIKMHFGELYQRRKDKDTMGCLDVNSAANSIVLKISKLTDELVKRDFEDAYKDMEAVKIAGDEFCTFAKVVVDGIKNVPEIYSRKTSKKILDCIGMTTKCETYREQGAEILNSAIHNYLHGKFKKEDLQDIFSDWVEEYSVDFKRIVKYISKDNVELIKEYVSDIEKEVLI